MPGANKQMQDPLAWSAALALTFLGLMVVRLGIPSTPYFDETHYLPAARAWLDGPIWTNREHPMLGKLMLSTQIAVLGDNAFAWRIVPALLGTLTLFSLMRALWFASQSFFATMTYGLLLASGFLLFVNSRIAMLDAAMFAFYAVSLWQCAAAVREPETGHWRLTIAGICMGLALGAKWNVAPLLPLPGLAFFFSRLNAGRRHLLTSKRGLPIPGISLLQAGMLLGVLPLAVYWLTYLPAHWAVMDPLPWLGFTQMHSDLFDLQSSVTQAHPYQSTLRQWALNIRPIWYLYENIDGAQRGIIMLGNPLTMLLGLPAMGWCLWAGIFRQRWDALAVAVLYGVSLGAWAIIDKPIQFYYHYVMPSSFLLAGLALALDEIRRRWTIWIPIIIVIASVALFAVFYPILSAAPLESETAFTKWMWLPSWR